MDTSTTGALQFDGIAAPTTHQEPNNNINILLVDDDAINQLVASKLLSKHGFKVTIAINGKEAVESVKNKNFQLILMDLHMPEMDGREATRNIRAMSDPYFKNIPIFSFSAAVNKKDEAIEMGMTDIAAKPLNALDLVAMIGKYVKNT
jgi:CheY-like chemotaxis protein